MNANYIPKYIDGYLIHKGDLVWTWEEGAGVVEDIYPAGFSHAGGQIMQEGGGLVQTDSGVAIMFDICRLCDQYNKKAVVNSLFRYCEPGTFVKIGVSELCKGLNVRICYEALAQITDIVTPDSELSEWINMPHGSLEFTYYGLTKFFRGTPVVRAWMPDSMRKATKDELPGSWVKGDLEILMLV